MTSPVILIENEQSKMPVLKPADESEVLKIWSSRKSNGYFF